MYTDTEYVSPDGDLCFVLRVQSGDFALGFKGTPWHTHGDILATEYGLTSEQAVRAFVQKLTGSELTIAVAKVDGKISYIWITDNPARELRHCPPEENIEFRLWDGTKITP